MSPKSKQEEEMARVSCVMWLVTLYINSMYKTRHHWTGVKEILGTYGALMAMLFAMRNMDAKAFSCMGSLVLTGQMICTIEILLALMYLSCFEGVLSWSRRK